MSYDVEYGAACSRRSNINIIRHNLLRISLGIPLTQREQNKQGIKDSCYFGYDSTRVDSCTFLCTIRSMYKYVLRGVVPGLCYLR